MAPNHRASDVVVCTGADITLQGKFYYGPLDLATLSGEMVRREREIKKMKPVCCYGNNVVNICG